MASGDWPQQDIGKSLATMEIGGGLIRNPSITEKLETERKILVDRLTLIDEALTALKSNPQLQALLDVVAKVHRY